MCYQCYIGGNGPTNKSINKSGKNSLSQWDLGSEDDGAGLYGVVKHMTDEPYSFDEYSYGRLPKPTTTSTTPRPYDIWDRKTESNHRLLVTPRDMYDSR